jgi:hypothetical protein
VKARPQTEAFVSIYPFSVKAALLAAATLLALAAPARAQEPDARLAAFREVCERPATYGDFSAAARDHGWRSVAPDADPGLSALARLTHEAVANEQFDTYARTIGGGRVFLFLTRRPVGQAAVIGCALYDFAAAAPLAPDAFQTWLGVEPSVSERGGGRILDWRQPDALPGVFEVRLNFITPASAMANATGYAGLSMSLERTRLPS